jgi:sortase A
VGVLLTLGGVGLLAWCVWEYVGTNAASKHRQAETVEAIREGWDEAGAASSDPAQVPDGAVGLLRVPRFGDGYEVPILTGFGDEALSRGVGWYPTGAAPGDVGNMVLAGHRVTRGEPFAHLADLRPGDRVVVETRRQVFVYEVLDDGREVVVPFTTGWPLWPVPDPDVEGGASATPTQAMVTLVTCAEVFHTDQRRVVRGVLVERETK